MCSCFNPPDTRSSQTNGSGIFLHQTHLEAKSVFWRQVANRHDLTPITPKSSPSVSFERSLKTSWARRRVSLRLVRRGRIRSAIVGVNGRRHRRLRVQGVATETSRAATLLR
jgi:hypothetical protein